MQKKNTLNAGSERCWGWGGDQERLRLQQQRRRGQQSGQIRSVPGICLTYIWPLYDLHLISVWPLFELLLPLFHLFLTLNWSLSVSLISVWSGSSLSLSNFYLLFVWPLFAFCLTSIRYMSYLYLTSVWHVVDFCLTCIWSLSDLYLIFV